jgi:hypothetical protein
MFDHGKIQASTIFRLPVPVAPATSLVAYDITDDEIEDEPIDENDVREDDYDDDEEEDDDHENIEAPVPLRLNNNFFNVSKMSTPTSTSVFSTTSRFNFNSPITSCTRSGKNIFSCSASKRKPESENITSLATALGDSV